MTKDEGIPIPEWLAGAISRGFISEVGTDEVVSYADDYEPGVEYEPVPDGLPLFRVAKARKVVAHSVSGEEAVGTIAFYVGLDHPEPSKRVYIPAKYRMFVAIRLEDPDVLPTKTNTILVAQDTEDTPTVLLMAMRMTAPPDKDGALHVSVGKLTELVRGPAPTDPPSEN